MKELIEVIKIFAVLAFMTFGIVEASTAFMVRSGNSSGIDYG